MMLAQVNANGTQGTQMVNWVDRNYQKGKDEKSKFTTDEDYELVYLRHRYIRRSPNPNSDRMKAFQKAAKSVARKAAQQFEYVFRVNGQDIDDLTNVALMHVVSYLGQFGLEEHPEKLEKFKKTFRKRKEAQLKKENKTYKAEDLEPTEKDIHDKDIKNCQAFIWQRLEEWGGIAATKNKNIRGTYSHTGYFKAPSSVDDGDIEDRLLLEVAEKFGFESITKKEFDETLKKSKVNKKSPRFEYNGHIYRKAYLSPTELTKDDVEATLYGESRSAFYSTPFQNIQNEQNPINETYRAKLLSELDNEDYDEKTHDNFLLADYLSEPSKIRMLKRYVEKNEHRDEMMSDVEQAIEFIRNFEPDYKMGFAVYGVGAMSVWPRR